MRAWVAGVLVLIAAVTVSADVVVLRSGSELECVVLQENTETVVVRRGYGTMTIPRSMITSIVRSPIITAPIAAPTTRPAAGQRVPPWNAILSALVKTKWATTLQQIPATVIDVGVMRNVPYQSYRCGTDYEVNIYGDPDRPAAIEIGIYRTLLTSDVAKGNCVELMASILPDKADAAVLRALSQKQDLVTRKDVTLEITPPTSADSYGGWWVSIYSEKELDAARASKDELSEITVARSAPAPAVTPVPASPALAPASPAKSGGNAVSEDWTPSDIRSARPSTGGSSGGGSVYVRGYHRKDGAYVRPHTRRK